MLSTPKPSTSIETNIMLKTILNKIKMIKRGNNRSWSLTKLKPKEKQRTLKSYGYNNKSIENN